MRRAQTWPQALPQDQATPWVFFVDDHLRTNRYEKALATHEMALTLDPGNERFRGQLDCIARKIAESQVPTGRAARGRFQALL